MSTLNCPNCGKPYQKDDAVCENCGQVFQFSTSLASTGAILHNRYEIVKLIHTGGMGYVYLAKDRTLFDRSCIVKQVKERIQSDEHQKKLEEEALRMSRLNHPEIAMIFDHFVEDRYYYVVMEYITGDTLSEVYKKRQGRLSERQVVNWAISICDVLGYLHAQGILHRDISPDNIMLTEEGTIKFIDFGTLREARYIAAGNTAGMGKYGYTAPEQWEGRPTPQSDIFALGATLYYLLTGFLPISKSYKSGKGPQKEDQNPHFPPIRSQDPDISARLEAVLIKALQTKAERRYDSAKEMADDLKKLSQEETKQPSVSPKTVILPESKAQKGSKAKGQRQKRSTGRKAHRRLAEETMSESVIRSRAVADTLQHPVVLISIAMSIAAAIYLVLLSPIFGGWQVSLGLTVVFAIAGLISYLSFYPKVHLEHMRGMMERISIEKEKKEQDDLKELFETLQSGFSNIDSIEATRVLNGLFNEHEQLQTALRQQRSTDPLSVTVLPALAAETYRRGLSVLSDTLDLMNVIQTPGRLKLEKDIIVLEDEIESLKENLEEDRVELKKEALGSLRDRLNKLSKLQLSVDQLLYQAQRCEASLQNTRIQLATIRAGSTKTSVDSVIEALQERINQVKEVQEEFNKLGY